MFSYNKDIVILLVAGGTGGHFFPALSMAEDFQKLGKNIHFITDLRCKKYLPKILINASYIIDLYIVFDSIVNRIRSIFLLAKAIVKTYFLIKKIKPSVVIGFGGYPTFPSMFVSILLRIPIIIYEQNSILGKVNSFFARYAKKILVAYDDTKNIKSSLKSKVIVIGDIVRNNIKNLSIQKNFYQDPFTLFVFGGSQGAKFFSTFIPQSIKLLKFKYPNLVIHIIQQVRPDDYVNVEKIYSSIGINFLLSDFFHDISSIYKETHLVISRAGASTIAEIKYLCLPTIFIPLPSSQQDHQYYNAQKLYKENVSWCYRQDLLSLDVLANHIYRLVINRDILVNMSKKLLFIKDNSKYYIVDTLLKIIEQINY